MLCVIIRMHDNMCFPCASCHVLVPGEAEMGETDVLDDDDGPAGKGVTKRRVGDMGKLSGAAGVYVEYDTGARSKPKKKKAGHVGESVLKKLKKTI